MNSALLWANMSTLPAGLAAQRFLPCFVAGTPIRTPDGSKAIEDLNPGDPVLSRDEFDVEGEVSPKIVEECFTREGEILELTIAGQLIETTPEHPFYEKENGWTAAGELQSGDNVASLDGVWLTIDNVVRTGRISTVYNFRVADHHTYFVGSPDWQFAAWVHNTYNVGGTRAARMAQNSLAEYRSRHLLPAFDEAVSQSGTVARTRIKGVSFFGVAGQQGALANVPLATRQRWLRTLQEAGLIDSSKYATLREVQSLSHAEAMSLMNAIDQLGAGKLGTRLTINVDRITCGLCKFDPGLNALKKYAGLKELNIVDKLGNNHVVI